MYSWIKFPISESRRPGECTKPSGHDRNKIHLRMTRYILLFAWSVNAGSVLPRIPNGLISTNKTLWIYRRKYSEDIEIFSSVRRCINRMEFKSCFPLALHLIRPKIFLGFLENAEILKPTIPWFLQRYFNDLIPHASYFFYATFI